MAVPAPAYTTIRPRRGGKTHAAAYHDERTTCGIKWTGGRWVVAPAMKNGRAVKLGCRRCAAALRR